MFPSPGSPSNTPSSKMAEISARCWVGVPWYAVPPGIQNHCQMHLLMWRKCLSANLSDWYEISVAHQVQMLPWPEGAWVGPLQLSCTSFEN